jgi:hypothetical protein
MCDDDKQDPIVMFFIAFRVCVCVSLEGYRYMQCHSSLSVEIKTALL